MPISTFDRAKRVVAALGLSALCACSAASADEGNTSSPESDLMSATASTEPTEVDSVKQQLHPTPSPTTPQAPDGTPRVQLHGVNLSAAEFGSALPGVFGKDYTFPTPTEIDYYVSKGMDVFRIPFMWERVQPSANGALDATYLAKLDAVVTYATAKGAHVILNPQNFAKYYTNYVGSAQVPNSVFADFWKKLAQKYKTNGRVMFCLMNEPHGLPTEQWVNAAQAAINGIRSVGSQNVILAPGNGWTGAWSWSQTGNYGTPNSVVMLNLTDPADNMMYEVHQYLDPTSGGAGNECSSKTIGSERLAGFVKWLRDNHKKGFVGEFAGARTATCYAAIQDMMTYMNKNADVLGGWLWWGGGPWWKSDYNFALDPLNGQDRPQMQYIAPML